MGAKTRASLIAAAVLAPLTIAAGNLLGSGNYYVTSVLVIIYAMVPFFAMFEDRRPQARELVIVAVLCAIAIAARAAFFWLPHFKPMVGIVMIAGIAFGPQVGFLTGAVSGLVSNFMFGQGPWTPWQMFAYGLAGLIMGLLAEKGRIPRRDWGAKAKVGISVFAAVLVVCVVGPILDTCSLFVMFSMMTPSAAVAIYAAGFPINCLHATATFVTVFVLGNPLLEKLTRVKVKYGMLE